MYVAVDELNIGLFDVPHVVYLAKKWVAYFCAINKLWSHMTYVLRI